MYSEQSHTLPEAAIQTSAPPPLLASSTFVNQPPSQSLLNNLPAQAINVTIPAEDDEDWPPPPPPVTDEFIEESRPLPPEKLVSELTELLRDMRTSSQEQPRYISPHHPPQARTPEYCTPFTPPRSEIGMGQSKQKILALWTLTPVCPMSLEGRMPKV
uniref:Uncharacterized protein n=1 Tax=Knipowitschia caucasica TaxID=637954 RepID=A0AAV2M0J4_KNICA